MLTSSTVALTNKTAGYNYILVSSTNDWHTRMSEYESGTFRCKDCAREFLTKEEADRHYSEDHSDVVVGE
jgi:hypothetical protein